MLEVSCGEEQQTSRRAHGPRGPRGKHARFQIHRRGRRPFLSPLPLLDLPQLRKLMGWFTRAEPEKPNAASRDDRKKCWESRDLYFSCLDAAQVVVPGSEGDRCNAQNKAFQQNCAKSWVRVATRLSVCPSRHSHDDACFSDFAGGLL